MTFTFSESLPADYCGKALLISGQDSLQFAGIEYLVVQDEDDTKAFEIKYEYHCSPFKQAEIVEDLILVGHEQHFYLYDLVSQRNTLVLQMDGYFGHFYILGDYIYVADSGTLFCLDKSGNTLWRNTNLGVDGVIVKKFADNKVYGSGEWDPPDDWVEFILDLKTGEKVKENVG